MFWKKYVELCNKAGEAPNTVAAKCGVKSTGTVTGWSNGAKPRAGVLRRISDYFGVSVEYLLGNEEAPADDSEREMNDKALKFALWGGDEDMDDEDLQAVRQYAAFIQERKRKEKK